MLYNDDVNKTGVCQEIDAICGTNSTNYSLPEKARRMNSALDDLFFIGMKECGNWSIVDSGRTDFGIATTDLVSGQSDYTFPSDLIILELVEIKDASGTWQKLEWDTTVVSNPQSGTPTAYRKIENSFILNATPNYNSTAGVRLTYRRAFAYATVSGTAFTPSSPAIPSIFHTWLARKASLPYLIDKGLQKKNDYASIIIQDEINIARFFGERSRDFNRTMTPFNESNR